MANPREKGATKELMEDIVLRRLDLWLSTRTLTSQALKLRGVPMVRTRSTKLTDSIAFSDSLTVESVDFDHLETHEQPYGIDPGDRLVMIDQVRVTTKEGMHDQIVKARERLQRYRAEGGQSFSMVCIFEKVLRFLLPCSLSPRYPFWHL